jgi:ADP-ribosylglycohydrolase
LTTQYNPIRYKNPLEITGFLLLLTRESAIRYRIEDNGRIYNNNWKLKDKVEGDRIYELPEEDIQSGGYVIHTLEVEASIWRLLNSNSYKKAVLKAVNLGEDTEQIPQELSQAALLELLMV